MTFGQFISILRARWWVVALVLCLAVGVTLIISLILPKQYTATASVVVDAKPDPISAMIYPGMASPAYMATQVDVIQSDRVAQRVVRNLKLAENPQVREQWQEATGGEGSIESWLGDTFQKFMDVKPSKDSNVITVTYRAADPRFAAALANAFIQAYMDISLELRVDPAKRYLSFFDVRAKEARDAVEKAQAKLSAYQREKGIVATDERFDVESNRLTELSSQLVTLQALSSESGSRQSQVRGGSADSMQEVLSNPLIAQMKADVARAEANLKMLSSRLGDSNPQVVEAKASLAELRGRMDTEVRRVTSGVSVSNTITQQRLAETQSALNAQRAKVLKMKATRDESDVLARDVDNSQKAYEAVLARQNQTSLESQTTQGNIYPLTQATPPLLPSSPKVFLNTALAFVLGCLLAAGTAMLLEFFDRRVRSIEELPLLFDIPVIGVMPKPNARRLFGRKRIPMMQQRLMAPLPLAGRGS